MISSVHLLSSAAIANTTSGWWWAIFGPIVFHYVLDVIPHWNPDLKKWSISKYVMVAVIDFGLAVLVILWLLDWQISLMMGVVMLFGILPDLVALFGFLFPNRFLDIYNKWHTNIQIHTYSLFGFLSQAVVLLVMGYMIYLNK